MYGRGKAELRIQTEEFRIDPPRGMACRKKLILAVNNPLMNPRVGNSPLVPLPAVDFASEEAKMGVGSGILLFTSNISSSWSDFSSDLSPLSSMILTPSSGGVESFSFLLAGEEEKSRKPDPTVPREGESLDL